MRWLFPALGFLITTFLAVVFCLDRDAQRHECAGFPINLINPKPSQTEIGETSN
jgi:hypothetical protein